MQCFPKIFDHGTLLGHSHRTRIQGAGWGTLPGILDGIENGEDQVFVAQLLLLYPAH